MPDTSQIEEVKPLKIDPAWSAESSISATSLFGTDWVKSHRSAVLKVPSAVVKTEHNYVLNPRHDDYAHISFTIAHDSLDRRLHDLGSLIVQ